MFSKLTNSKLIIMKTKLMGNFAILHLYHNKHANFLGLLLTFC